MSSVTASTLTSATVAASSAPASCTTAVPGNYGYVPPDACNSNYNFNPQYAPAVAVAVIFGILTGVHVLLGFVFRKPYTWVMIMGAIWETLAFVLHALGAHDQQNQGMSIAYTILFLLAPLWINAFVYMTFARAVYFFSPSHKVLFVQATGMSKYFVWLDVLTFLVQAVGGSMATPGAGDASIHAGLRVYLGGVGAQQLCILLFLSLMVVFHRECLVRDATCPPDASRRSWKGLLYCLYTALALITVCPIRRAALSIVPGKSDPFPPSRRSASATALPSLPTASRPRATPSRTTKSTAMSSTPSR